MRQERARTPNAAVKRESVRRGIIPFSIKELVADAVKAEREGVMAQTAWGNTGFSNSNSDGLDSPIDNRHPLLYRDGMHSNSNTSMRSMKSSKSMKSTTSVESMSMALKEAQISIANEDLELEELGLSIDGLDGVISVDEKGEDSVVTRGGSGGVGGGIFSINVCDYGLGDDKAACLAAAILLCPSLTTLNIAGNRLTDKSCEVRVRGGI